MKDALEHVSKTLRQRKDGLVNHTNICSNRHAVDMLVELGRLRHAIHIAARPGTSVWEAQKLSRGWRLIRNYPAAMAEADRIEKLQPTSSMADTLRAAILADTGFLREAHALAVKTWGHDQSQYTAKVLARTAKSVQCGDHFAEATAFLDGLKAARWR
jgi:hypothetical protein